MVGSGGGGGVGSNGGGPYAKDSLYEDGAASQASLPCSGMGGQLQPVFYPACGYEQTLQTNQMQLSGGQYEAGLLAGNLSKPAPTLGGSNDCYGFCAMAPAGGGLLGGERCGRFTSGGHVYDVPHRACGPSLPTAQGEKPTLTSHYNLPQPVGGDS